MRILTYKGITFDNYTLYREAINSSGCEYGYPSDAGLKLKDYKEANVYICPFCISRYDLYKEAETDLETIDKYIIGEYDDGAISMICGVKGCQKKNAFDTCLSIEKCTLSLVEPSSLLQSETMFQAKDKLGKTYTYVFKGVNMDDSTGCSYICLHNLTLDELTEVSYSWFKERKITVITNKTPNPSMKSYYSLEDAINNVSNRFTLGLKDANKMNEDEINAAFVKVCKYVKFVEHPNYIQLVPKEIATGKFIL